MDRDPIYYLIDCFGCIAVELVYGFLISEIMVLQNCFQDWKTLICVEDEFEYLIAGEGEKTIFPNPAFLGLWLLVFIGITLGGF